VRASDELHGRLAFQQPPAMAIQSWVATPVGNIWKITNSNQVADVAVWEKKHGPRKVESSKISKRTKIQWIGLRENLQETIDFPIKYGAFL